MIKYITKEGKQLPYLINNKNNKNSYFKFKPEYILVSKSRFHSEKKIIEILTLNFDKYYHKFMSINKHTPSNNEIILEGNTYQLIIINESNKFYYVIRDNELIVNTRSTDIDKIKHKIYKDYLEKMIERIRFEYTNVLTINKIKERKIILQFFKTKFGSYHKNIDIIKLNIALAKFEIDYLYYVIMHEYAHTKVFNHSSDFYNMLETLMPNYKIYDKKLKEVSIWL